MDLNGSKFKGLLGDIPQHFIGVINGYSGNGKTEFCIQLAKEFSCQGKAAWLSYEQRHGYDLQKATIRNKMEENSGNFIIIDPLHSLKAGVSLLEDLDNYLKRRNSPEFIFIDSLDYTGFNWEDYLVLKNKYGHKKTFIFIAHANKNGSSKKAITDKIIFDGGMCINVRDFIATPTKNRFGGFEPYVVFEEKARERNPLFFSKRLQEKAKTTQGELFNKTNTEAEGKTAQKTPETIGVDAPSTTKTEG